ncbi:glycosyltransferase family 2 protein [Arthrobacter sp. ISL-65]|uniref:glycosyltransferase family 2 protein n=1 Tax=Arthrobacter sp. ISL-65 TaxID=2819112 RepID=UPI001BEC2932|nr:glycosyltransferase [Arthrobacter sp. ISL-65]
MTLQAPQVTLVTVCYEDMENVKRTCQSIASQHGELLAGYEHLLVDGASTDGTQEWYKSNHPLPASRIMSEPDDGIFDAMNKAIRHARGEYIVFINAGDTFSDGGVLQRVSAVLRDASPQWSYGRARIVNSIGAEVRNPVGSIPYSRVKHALGLGTICHQTVFMKTKFIRELGGFDTTYGYAADYHLLLRAAVVSPPHTRDDICVLYGVGGVSDTDVFRQLQRRHEARVSAYNLVGLSAWLDESWTRGQVGYIRMKKLAKRTLSKLGVRRFFGRIVS